MLLFLLKTTPTFKSKVTYQGSDQKSGLEYNDTTLENLVNRDTDGDGILDWEENLYELDPNKKETTPGIPDSTAMSQMKNEQGSNVEVDGSGTEQLTQTDQFSRELFGTIASLSQSGTMSQDKIDELSASIADHIQNSPQRKIFSSTDIHASGDNSVQAFTNYNNTTNSTYKKYKTSYTVLDVLQKFVADENNIDASVLSKLDPIISNTNKTIDVMLKMDVPDSISTLHVNVINSLQRLVENLTDIRQYDSDPIVALGGISKYKENTTILFSDLNNLTVAINQKLKK